MTTPTTRHDLRRSRLARAAGALLAALFCAGLAACGPAGSGGAAADEALDTSRLPRVSGARQLYASPLSTVYVTQVPVGEAAGAIAKSLTSDGWQRYVAPFTDYLKTAAFQMMSFKKGPQAIQVSVSRAPAQGNATSVSYTAIVLTNDLPVPADATDIAFDPERPYLSCTSARPVAETLEDYTRALAKMGFALWPGLAQQEANKKAGAEPPTAAHAYFVRDEAKPLHLVLHREGDATKIELESVSAETLTAELSPDPAPPVASEERFHAKKPADATDKMIDDAMQQMTEAILKVTGGVVAGAGKPPADKPPADKPKAPTLPAMPEMPAMPAMPDMPAMPEMPEMPAMPAEADPVADETATAEPGELVAEDMDGFPIPESHTSTHSGETKYRIEREVTVPAPLKTVLAFYRRELPKGGFKEADMFVEGDMTVLKLTTPTGQGALTLRLADGETSVSFIERREAEARKAGILPKSGQAKFVFGSMAETPATVTIGKETIKLEPGMGVGKTPDGPMLDLAPGKYAYSVAVPGAPASNDEVVVADGEAWALIIGPGGGAMPLHMY